MVDKEHNAQEYIPLASINCACLSSAPITYASLSHLLHMHFSSTNFTYLPPTPVPFRNTSLDMLEGFGPAQSCVLMVALSVQKSLLCVNELYIERHACATAGSNKFDAHRTVGLGGMDANGAVGSTQNGPPD